MKLIIDVEKDYYEMLKYNVEQGQEYKPFEIIANGIPYEDRPQGDCENCDYRKFTEKFFEKFVDVFIEVMDKTGITSVEQLSEMLKGDAE